MDRLETFMIVAPVLLFSMVAHEYAHGYAALKQGDPTASNLGRLTWNPLKHIDPFMTILLPTLTFFAGGFLFGGAKPVPVVPSNYRNYRRGDIIVSLAGVVTNLVIAILCVPALFLFGVLGRAVPAIAETCAILQIMLNMGILFNLMLAMFNLLPLPPLDGSHVMKYLLPPAWALRYQQLGMYGLLILILMLATGAGRQILTVWMSPVFLFSRMAMDLVGPYILTSRLLLG